MSAKSLIGLLEMKDFYVVIRIYTSWTVMFVAIYFCKQKYFIGSRLWAKINWVQKLKNIKSADVPL